MTVEIGQTFERGGFLLLITQKPIDPGLFFVLRKLSLSLTVFSAEANVLTD